VTTPKRVQFFIRKNDNFSRAEQMKNLESGVSAEVLARDYGVTGATLYNWKPKYRGMAVSQVRRLKKLEEENWK